MRRLRSSCACVEYYPGLCSPLIDSVVSNAASMDSEALGLKCLHMPADTLLTWRGSICLLGMYEFAAVDTCKFVNISLNRFFSYDTSSTVTLSHLCRVDSFILTLLTSPFSIEMVPGYYYLKIICRTSAS